MFKIKICGIVDGEDTRAALDLGADAVGVLVGVRHRAEDSLTLPAARAVCLGLPASVLVLVTHLSRAEDIADLSRAVGSGAVQLQGPVSLREARRLRRRLPGVILLKAFHIESRCGIVEETAGQALHWQEIVDAFILDSIDRRTDRIGGTGMVHDWTVSRELVRTMARPVILAGGLGPLNVEEAVRTVSPFGVDVNSGVEEPKPGWQGRKNFSKLEEFIRKARSVL